MEYTEAKIGAIHVNHKYANSNILNNYSTGFNFVKLTLLPMLTLQAYIK